MKSYLEFSIIVTVYNIRDYIVQCIDSILSQKNVSFEIVCVDDCSTDGSWELLQSFARHDDRIHLLRTKQNSGLASSRNIGLKASVGKYVYNIDGDDLLEENALETMHKYMDEFDLDMLSFSALSFYDDEKLKNFGSKDEYIRKYEYPGIWDGRKLFAELMKNNERVFGNMVLYCFRNSFIRDNNLYLTEGLRYSDDRMFSCFMNSKRVMCINMPLYRRRYRVGSAVTGEKRLIYLESMIVGLRDDLATWMSCDNDSEVNEQVIRYFDARIREVYWLENVLKFDTSEMVYLEQFATAKYLYELIFKKRNVYDEMVDTNIIEKVRSYNNLYLYGAGDIAKKVANVLEFHGIINFNFVVTRAYKKYYLNRRVYSISDLDPGEKPVFIIATSSKYSEDIKKTLEERGFHNIYAISRDL